MTLYAKWTQGSVTVTFNTNGGVNLDPNTKTVAYGKAYGELPIPERSGYGFTGWFTAADETGTEVTASTTVNTTEPHTLYAHWVELKVIPASVFDFGDPETFTYEKDVDRDDVKLVKAPVTELALEMGNAKVLNVIMLGVYVGYTEVVPPEVVWDTIEHKLGKKPKLLPLNKAAFEKGLELGRAQK